MVLKHNPNWDRQPPKVKKIFFKNLPLPFPILGAIFFAIILMPQVIKNMFFPSFDQFTLEIIIIITLSAYVLGLYALIALNYQKKTGKDLAYEVVEKQNKNT